jgi:hypothetical protein
MEPASKRAENKQFMKDGKGSTYADLSSCWDAVREPLTKNGLSVVQLAESNDGTFVTVETILLHESGEFISGRLTMRPTVQSPQGIGSAITYARRYGLTAIVGLTQHDDDGNAASEKSEPAKPTKQKALEQSPGPSPALRKALEFEIRVSKDLIAMAEGRGELNLEQWLDAYAPEYSVTCENDEAVEGPGKRVWELLRKSAEAENIPKATLREMYTKRRKAI